MSAEAAFTTSWKVGKKYTATLNARRPSSGAPQCVLIEWSPAVPTRLGETEIAEYIAGRNLALSELAAEFGIKVALVEA